MTSLIYAKDTSTIKINNTTSPPSLIVLLHGFGDSEYGLLPLASTLGNAVGGAVVVSLRAPHERYGGYAWFDGSSTTPERIAFESQIVASTESVLRFVDEAPKMFGTDIEKSYVFGFSQGATIAWTMAVSQWPRKNLLRGIVCMSGRLMPLMFEENGSTDNNNRTSSLNLGSHRLAHKDELSERPIIWSAHGRNDSVTPFRIGVETVSIADKYGVRNTFVEHHGDHEVDTPLPAALRYLKGLS